MDLPAYVSASEHGTYVDVFVQPRSAKNAVVGVHGPALKLKVTAPPVDGRANDAAVRVVADMLSLPPSKVAVRSGRSSRHKRLVVSEMAPEDVACELMRVLSSRGHDPG